MTTKRITEKAKERDAMLLAMGKLAYVVDALNNMHKGDFNGMAPEDYAYFIGAGMEKTCVEIERAMIQRKMVRPDRGFFTDLSR
jgi:hypothetical protein